MTTHHYSPTLFLVPHEQLPDLAWEPMTGATGVDHKVLYDAGETVAGLLRLRPGGIEPTHLHVDGEHHMWVLAGRVLIDDTALGAGSYLHVPARLTHRVQDDGEGSLVFYVYCPADGNSAGWPTL